MFDSQKLDDLAKRLSGIIPESLREQKQEFERKVYEVLQSGFSKLDLVTREEFDAQVKVLAKTREKLDKLEKHFAELEKTKPPKPRAKAKKED
ncbi:MAG: accessory factor UbiK family protein [Gammaproteobacteria bacterium]